MKRAAKKSRKDESDAIDLVDFNKITSDLGSDHGHDLTTDYSATFAELKNVRVIFRNLKPSLIQILNKWSAVIGCVAWMTDFDVLDAMKAKSLGLLIQKEDFLRPELDKNLGDKRWISTLRGKYDRMSAYGIHYRSTYDFIYLHFNTVIGSIEIATGREALGETLCFGIPGRDHLSRPNMHDKFLVFGVVEEVVVDDEGYTRSEFKPKAVWTGSFNLSKNASRSIDNAVYIEDERIAQVYYNEWAGLYLYGERLDWTSTWVKQQFSLGT